MRALGSDAVAPVSFPVSPRSASRPPARITPTLAEQTVEVPRTAEFGRVIAQVAQRQRPRNATAVAVTFEERLEGHERRRRLRPLTLHIRR
jgi:hypothetical protein